MWLYTSVRLEGVRSLPLCMITNVKMGQDCPWWKQQDKSALKSVAVCLSAVAWSQLWRFSPVPQWFTYLYIFMFWKTSLLPISETKGDSKTTWHFVGNCGEDSDAAMLSLPTSQDLKPLVIIIQPNTQRSRLLELQKAAATQYISSCVLCQATHDSLLNSLHGWSEVISLSVWQLCSKGQRRKKCCDFSHCYHGKVAGFPGPPQIQLKYSSIKRAVFSV